MSNASSLGKVGLGVLVLATWGCAAKPAAPFDVLKNANVTAFRLQNYEPPAAAAAPTAGAPIAGLPPEIQQLAQMAQQALPGLQQLIPPGLLPPGMIPGQQAAPAAPPQAPRFVDFRILGQTQVMDSKVKEKLGQLFGDKGNYQTEHQNCMYPELGVSFTPPEGAPRYDMLVSFSCNQVNAVNFTWPYQASGMTPSMVKSLSQLVPDIFPSGMAAAAPMTIVASNGVPSDGRFEVVMAQ